ncbi:4-alpha-glucanotransferase [Corynebacterium kutscheri]|uniref:4-alpha-glucanotransferase n=1 Tax=Corynebacterium kutscheri TaxID=35755 RepID=A0AB38VRT3_9CORY|nr:4-alpha-glucanotransferase [Corynebacterium kutscheri]
MARVGYIDSLRELAAAHNVSWSYTGFGGTQIDVSEDTLVKTLRALGVELGTADMPSEEEIRQAIEKRYADEFKRPLPRCIVSVQGHDYIFPVHVIDGAPADIEVTLEDGSVVVPEQVENWTAPRTFDGVSYGEASFRLPADLPLGWHTVTLRSEDLTASCFLIVTPQRLSTTDRLLNKPVTGVMAQIYSVRSQNSWGMGDFNDLGHLADTVARTAGADFLLINPMHAAEPFAPVEDSPYLPTTRRFTNPIYIRIEDIPELLALDEETQADIEELANEFRELNTSAGYIERNPIYEAKLQVLREIFACQREPAREQDFQDYLANEGQGLYDFATWCAEQEIEAHHLAASHSVLPDKAELVNFYMWLQWICDQQLGAAQSAAIDAGMRIGIMADLAVGVHPGGADAATLKNVLAPLASVGAPPDNYNHHGQDWSQPPWHPELLAEQGYIPWRDLLRTVLRHSGGIRVDHVLGLFRLFWIPRLQHPSTGTYVNFDHKALVGILALEAERANAVVIGEDLGTFEPWVQDFLASRGIMGTSIVWFESSPHGGPRHQHEYRPLALSSVSTHDLPPTAGYLEGEHIALRDRLGILATDVETENTIDLQWQAEILTRVKEEGGFEDNEVVDNFYGIPRNQRGDTETLITALHRFLAGTPSALTCMSLVDMVGDKRAQNQPGTTNDLYPNWCVPLTDSTGTAITIEQLADNRLYQKVAQASQR